MSFAQEAKSLVLGFCEQRPLRTGSLVITVYGDAIEPRGGSVWLGSLIKLLDNFHINERLVRTSVFRLVQDEWLAATRIGRRSFYALTAEGLGWFRAATRRIYSLPNDQWDGHWCLVILTDTDQSARDLLRRDLGWLGFSSVAPGVFAHPSAQPELARQALDTLKLADRAVIMRADQLNGSSSAAHRLVRESWKLDDLEARYKHFVTLFQPVLTTLRAARTVDALAALQVRLLLIHEYRKILLRDPQLPALLLSSHWTGHDAFALCGELYARLQPASERYLTDNFETADGKLPEPAAPFFDRFGGILRNSTRRKQS